MYASSIIRQSNSCAVFLSIQQCRLVVLYKAYATCVKSTYSGLLAAFSVAIYGIYNHAWIHPYKSYN